jgi:multicomponent Na+:H+ antiporter subunit D
MEHSVPMMIVLPLAMAFFIPMVSRRYAWVPDYVGNLTMMALAIMSLSSMDFLGTIYHVGGWPTPIGIDLRVDGLTALMLIAVNVIGFAAALFSIEYIELYTSKFRYYSLFLLMVAGMNGAVLTGDIFNLFVFMEIASIASYALVGFGCEHEELEASFKYAVLGSVASTLILVGIGFLYGVTGTLNMAHVAAKIQSGGMNMPLLFALGLFIVGYGLKAALVPFHAWLPDAHPSAPAPVSAMLSGVVIKAIGVYVLARLLFNVFGIHGDLLLLLRWMGVISMVVGVLLAVGQWDMKRLFAYHSISQIGYVVLGLGIGTPLGVVGGLFHLINHSFFKSLLFLNAGSVEFATGTRDLKRLGGMARALPATGLTSMIASMSIAGIPPFNGFWSKLIIILACVQAGHLGLAGWAIFVSLLTLASFLKVQKYAFYGERPKAYDGVQPPPIMMTLAMMILAVCCMAMSLFVITGFDSPLLIGPAADALLRGVFPL